MLLPYTYYACALFDALFMVMSTTLNTVYENARVFVKILKDCTSLQVSDWKIEDVKRALNWVQYFQKVNEHVGNKVSLLQKLDSRVKEIGRLSAIRFGQEEVTFHFLVHNSLQYCLQSLVDNSFLPNELQQYIQLYYSELLGSLMTCSIANQQLISSLTNIHIVLKDLCLDDPTLSLHSLDATFLKEDMSWLLLIAETRSDSQEAAACRLSSLAEVDGGMEAILLALLQESGSADIVTRPQQFSALDPVRKFILMWLVSITQASNENSEHQQGTKDTGISEAGDKECGWFMWLPSCTNLLIRVSLAYFHFFKEHLKFLIQETQKLECQLTSIITSHKEKESNQEKVDLIHSHWTGLVCAEGNVRDVCLNIIKSRVFPRTLEVFGTQKQNKQLRELCHLMSSVDGSMSNNASIWVDILKKIELH